MYPFHTCAASGRASYPTAVSWSSRIKGAVIHDSALVYEPATGLHRPPQAVMAERLAEQAETFYRLRRAVIRRAEGNRYGSPAGSPPGDSAAVALRSAFTALGFSIRTNAASLAVPVRLVCEDRHQRALWERLVRRHARLGEPLAFSGGDGGALAVLSGTDELGLFSPADQGWVTMLRGFSVAPYVGRVIGGDRFRLTLEVVVAHVGAAVTARRQALGLTRRPGGDGLAGGLIGGDGEAATLPEAPTLLPAT